MDRPKLEVADIFRRYGEAYRQRHDGSLSTAQRRVMTAMFVISHDRRKILHFNVTRNPNALWVVQQLREAWTYKQPHSILAIRPRRKVWSRGGFGCEGLLELSGKYF
jgi:hypothetical protein